MWTSTDIPLDSPLGALSEDIISYPDTSSLQKDNENVNPGKAIRGPCKKYTTLVRRSDAAL
jgi:hypothetical protein